MQPATLAVTDDGTPDIELAQRIGKRDHRAFQVMMRRYNQMLFRVARSILKDDAEAEDAVQESYLLAYRAIEGFRGDAKLSTWLVRIVANESIGRLRKRNRGAEVIHLDGDAMSEDSREESMNESTPERPEGATLRAETRKLLEAKIDELPDAFRTVFVLRAVEEMSVDEAAAALGIPEATVRTRFFRARGLLRESLSREIDLAHADAFGFAGTRCDRIIANMTARLEALDPA